MFARVLAVVALACFVPVLIHVILGADGDMLVGIPVPSVVDASYDSQNRFYGAAFGIYGALLLYCVSDIARYAGVLKITFAGIFAGGCARLLSYYAHGLPSTEVLVLLATEIVVPPILWLWLNRELAAQKQ